MRITCPHCGFAKMITAEQIPANVIRVSCPSCKQPFPLTREETLESAATVENIAAETVVSTTTVTSPADKTETLTEPKQTESTIADQTLETDSENSEIAPDHETTPDPLGAENFELASIGARYAALLIDTFLLLIMVFTLRFGLSLLSTGVQLEGHILLNLIFMLFTLVLGFTYHALFIGICGQTPGKRFTRIKVVMIDQTTMTYPKAMLREILGKTLSATFLLGYVMALFHPERLTAHDKIADTRVIKFANTSPRG
jgi:predicted Zn finger-like uncharacterized protein